MDGNDAAVGHRAEPPDDVKVVLGTVADEVGEEGARVAVTVCMVPSPAGR